MRIVIGIFKRILGIFLSLFVSIFSMFGNNNSQDLPTLNQIAKTQNDYCNEVGNEIIRCLKENDRYGINNLFCDKVKDTDYLKKKIDIVFNYIDNSGGIVLDDGKWKIGASHGSNDGKGGRTIDFISCQLIGNIKMRNKKIYMLGFNAYKKFKFHNDLEGVLDICFYETTGENTIRGVKKNNKNYMGINIFNISIDGKYWENIIPMDYDINKDYLFDKDFFDIESKK